MYIQYIPFIGHSIDVVTSHSAGNPKSLINTSMANFDVSKLSLIISPVYKKFAIISNISWFIEGKNI